MDKGGAGRGAHRARVVWSIEGGAVVVEGGAVDVEGGAVVGTAARSVWRAGTARRRTVFGGPGRRCSKR